MVDARYKQYLMQFSQEYLTGELALLKHFDLSQLRGRNHIQYGASNLRNGRFDCDNTKLMRVILYMLAAEHMDGLAFEDIGTGKKYRGDTINSFRSLFGWTLGHLNDDDGSYKSLVRRRLEEVLGKDTYVSFLESIQTFKTTYHTIGNILLMYNERHAENTINRERGMNVKLQDFFDLFLAQVQSKLEKGYAPSKQCDALFTEECCHDYFKNSLEAYRKHHFLTMYYQNEDIQFYQIHTSGYRKEKGRWRVILRMRDEEIQTYYQSATDYMEEATKRIHERADQMILSLSKQLQDS